MGAPEGNTNALKTGRRSARPGTVLARLGPRYAQAYQDVLRLRRQAETLLRQKHGGLTLLQAARLQTACRLELNCRLAELAIRDKLDMSTEEMRAERSLIAQWSQQRDNALAALLGDSAGAEADPWARLDAAMSQQAQDRPAAPAAPKATDAPDVPTAGTQRIQEAADTTPHGNTLPQ
jgi:hypothetical protein